jgi:hypothetical protein
MIERGPPPAACKLEGREVEVTPHPVSKKTPKRPIMSTILSEVLLTVGLSPLPSKRRVISSLTTLGLNQFECEFILIGSIVSSLLAGQFLEGEA